MTKMDLVMFEEEFEQLQEIIGRLQQDSASKVVFLVDKNGQQIAASGDVRSIDATSLASLTAGNVRRRQASRADFRFLDTINRMTRPIRITRTTMTAPIGRASSR